MLFTLLLFMSFSSCFGQGQGYAVFDDSTDPDTPTLTFKYGTPTGTAGTDYYNTDNTGTSDPGWYDKRESIKKVVFDSSFANARPKSCCWWFKYCTNLTDITGIEYLNTSNVTNMAHMFFGCSGLTDLDVSNFNTANVTNMSDMFYYCSSLTSLDVTHFNTAKVTDMGSMFSGCIGLTSLDVSNFNTAKVTNMYGMFRGCSGLTSLDVSKFNTASVTNMSWMFIDCSGLTSLNLSNFNTEKVTTMGGMFGGCPSLTSLNVSNFNTANVTNMNSMFEGCSGLTSLDLSNFNTANVTNMHRMFRCCSGLTSLDVSNFNTANVTDMSWMFIACSGLTSLDLSKFNTAKVTNMNGMFSYCSRLTSLDVSHFNTANVTRMDDMFSGCSSLTNLDVSKFNTASVTNMGNMFDGCRSLTSLDVSKFNTAKVTNMNGMFSYCSRLTSLDVSHFNTANVTRMDDMFSGCSSLTNLDVSKFNTASVTNMGNMFDGCRSLTSLDVSKFNTANVISMICMFRNCSNLTSLDVSHFDTAKVTTMGSMFWNCYNLTSLTFGENFTTASCTSYKYVFSGCSRLRYLDFYASNDKFDVDDTKSTKFFTIENLNREESQATALFGSKDYSQTYTVYPGLPLTTVIYMPHGISKSDYTNYTDLPNLVFNDGGTLKAANYYSEDKVDIELPREFKTTKAEYSRTMKAATQYGTVILPYEFTTNESVQAYLLRAEHTGTMWYEEVESVPAHTPFFYSKKTASDTNVNFNKTVANYGITVAATHTTSNAEGGQPYDAASGMDGWTTKGYYITETVDASSGNTYYISGDKFWRATGTLKMYPHRVTYQGQWQYDPDATEAPAMLNIITMGADDLPSEVSTAIEAAHLRSLQQGARDIYDAQGRRQSELKSGLNIVRMADGTTVKIVKR